MMRNVGFCLLTVLCAPSIASAQVSDALIDSELVRWRAHSPSSSGFGGDLGVGRFDGDWFVSLVLRFDFNQEYWGFGVQAPVRMRLTDSFDRRDDDVLNFIRGEDWDEIPDYFRFFRYFYVGKADKSGPFYLRIGELANVSVGHGTIVRRYHNGIDADVWRIGVNAAVNIGGFGLEALVGDVFDPMLAGGRLKLHPVQLFSGGGDNAEDEEDDGSSIGDRFYFGVSAFSDPRAPNALRRNAEGEPVRDEQGHYIVAGDRDHVTVVGGDVGIELLGMSMFSINPYFDFNKVIGVDDAWGAHMGVLWGLNIPLGIDNFVGEIRTEYRRVAGNYISPYFDTVYELERQLFPLGVPSTQQRTKRGFLTTANADQKNGVYVDFLLGLPNWVVVTGEYTDYDGPVDDGILRIGLIVPILDYFKFTALYFRSNIGGLDDLFSVDDRSVFVVEAEVPFYSFFNAQVRWWRTWRADEEGFDAEDNWSVGVGFQVGI